MFLRLCDRVNVSSVPPCMLEYTSSGQVNFVIFDKWSISNEEVKTAAMFVTGKIDGSNDNGRQ
ncbi:hypothetical protein AAE478_002860 [Parahypoxylon ruwenzoriense]